MLPGEGAVKPHQPQYDRERTIPHPHLPMSR
jgi:hypothetical protein